MTTSARKRRFLEQMLAAIATPIGLVDVGAGGPRKSPWTLLPVDRVRSFEFEPEAAHAGAAAACVSDHEGRARLFVARDPRSSSLHPASDQFVRRFANDSILANREIDVDCVTLDSFLAGRCAEVDAVDINAEGHDARVVTGAAKLLADGGVSLLKIEVLFAEVWQGQGWFSDIDAAVRHAGYDLVDLELDFGRPAAVRRIHHRGELLWGKAFYVPSAATCAVRVAGWHEEDPAAAEDRVLKAVALLVMIEALGRAVELIDTADRFGALRRFTAARLRTLLTTTFRFARVEAETRKLLRAMDPRPLGRAVAQLAVRP